MRTTIAAILIFAFWFLLSGHTEILLITLGILSTLLSIFLASRMKLIDHESYPIHLSSKLIRFYSYLAGKMLRSNMAVIKIILKPQRSINPQVVNLPIEKKTDLAKVIYANSITLTPGTVTLEISNNNIQVHALNKESLADLETGEIANAVPDDKELVS